MKIHDFKTRLINACSQKIHEQLDNEIQSQVGVDVSFDVDYTRFKKEQKGHAAYKHCMKAINIADSMISGLFLAE